MHIVHLGRVKVPSRSASSLQVAKMCQAFGTLGHRVTLLGDPGEETATRINHFYGTLSAPFSVQLIPPWEGAWGIHVTALQRAATARILGADLCYSRNVLGALSAASIGIPSILEIHELPTKLRPRSRLYFRAAIRHPRVLRVVLTSRTLMEDFTDIFPESRGKTLFAHNGADVPIDYAPVRIERERLEVAYVGHLYPGKGMEVVVAMAARCPWADFHVVGGTDADIDRWKAEAGDLPNVKWHGFVMHADTEKIRQQADVLVAPYQETVGLTQSRVTQGRWITPIKIFEYMASGRAILASNLAVAREVLTHESDALLCAPAEIEQWCAALERLRDDPALRERLGTAARHSFRENYSWERRAQRVLEGVT